MNKYKNLSHISKLLWHFMGPKEEGGHQGILERLEKQIVPGGSSFLDRYLGNGDFYEREVNFEQMMSDWENLGELSTLADKGTFIIKEPRCLCFCDIPINTLSEHMNKYGDIGLGFKKEVLEKLVNDLKPVRYYPVRNKEDLLGNEENLWSVNTDEVLLGNYLKIPTNYTGSINYINGKNTETFEQIYEEREWRSFLRLEFKVEDLAYILLPTRSLVTEKLYPNLYGLIRTGVGIIYADEFYQKDEGVVL